MSLDSKQPGNSFKLAEGSVHGLTKGPLPAQGSVGDLGMLDKMARAAATAGLDPAEFQPPETPEGDTPDAGGQWSTDPSTSANPPPLMDDHTPHDEADLAGQGVLGSTVQPDDASPTSEPSTALATQDAPQKDPEQARRAKLAATALYGSDFPLMHAAQPDAVQWVGWARTLWDRHRPGMQKILHLVERNRLMRGGDQWVTSTGVGPWREPPKARDTVRAVENLIAPALDLRVQILREQVPGFKTRPTTQEPEAAKKAEAQQMALEYSYHEQSMPEVLAEAAYWAGTDGCAFLGPYWHPDEGPWSETEQAPLGDVRTCVYRIEQVRVSANATATKRPHYWVLRETIPTADAVAMHGQAVTNGDMTGSQSSDLASTMGASRLGIDTVGVTELYREQDTVDRYTVYCERSEFLPDGLTLIICGESVIFAGPLLYSVVPVVRITDGSSDPAFYPTPVMNGWVAHQQRINALISKWIESIRVNAGGRFLMKSGTVATETLVGGTTSFMEVKGGFAQLSDAIQAVQGFSVGQDVKDALEREVATFEKKSGWNDASRGSFASDASGRAILAVREQLERTFAPGVASAAYGMSEWGKIVLHIYRAMLSLPRVMAITGQGRPDLAQELTADDFDGVAEVEIDPETLMPMPRSLKLTILDQLYQEQVITAQEYRRRLPFAFTGSIETPDDSQTARGQRVADAIVRGQPVPEMRWTDNESLHQDVLERQILTRDGLDPMVVQAAMQRWTELANQAAMKSGGMMPPMGGPQGMPGMGHHLTGGPPDATPLPPQIQPMSGSNPSIAAQPQMLHQADQQAAGMQFDQMSPQ